jgi:hypothetical protein
MYYYGINTRFLMLCIYFNLLKGKCKHGHTLQTNVAGDLMGGGLVLNDTLNRYWAHIIRKCAPV